MIQQKTLGAFILRYCPFLPIIKEHFFKKMSRLYSLLAKGKKILYLQSMLEQVALRINRVKVRVTRVYAISKLLNNNIGTTEKLVIAISK